MHHELKTLPQDFNAVVDGRKTFEIRENVGRDFRVGDTVTLREYDPSMESYPQVSAGEDRRYTGREYGSVIGYVTAYEQQPGYVVFSLMRGVFIGA